MDENTKAKSLGPYIIQSLGLSFISEMRPLSASCSMMSAEEL